MIKSLGNLRTTIQLTVVLVFLLATTMTAALAIGLQYYFGQSQAKQSATNLYAAASANITAELVNITKTNRTTIELLADNPLLADPSHTQKRLQIFAQVLQGNPLFYGIYVGSSDGSFFEVVNLNSSETSRQQLRALPSDRWLLITVAADASSRTRQFHYLNENLETRLIRSEPTDFNSTQRPWYLNAMETSQFTTSEPYLFDQLGVPGTTLSKRIQGTETVIAADMTLSSISSFLAAQVSTDTSDIYLYNGEGEIIASSQKPAEQSGEPNLPALKMPRDEQELVSSLPAPKVSVNEDRAIAALGPRQEQFPVDRWLNSGSALPATTNTVPSQKMLTVAANPRLHNSLVETEYQGQSYLLFASAANKASKRPLYIGILAPEAAVIGPMLDKVKLSIALTAMLLLALVPLSWLFARPIVGPVRQLAIENDKVRRRAYDEVQRVDSRINELDELSESMVNMVKSIQAHELAQRELMDSFIKLIAQAIDDKSAYTGGHCERVPELALMLAHHASSSSDPAFKSFHLQTEDEWREYRIAAWLHDCGKITTPEHIVDKGSKLEVIYNRLHEIRMRFEVLWRDAEIQYWQLMAEHPEDQLELQAALKDKHQQLIADFEFVAACNVGGEFLEEQDQQRLRQLAENTWQRHFSDRIGLSPVEELRCTPEVSLPATEALLNDRPEHIISRPNASEYPPELGINMDIPEYLYNQGEIYNLSISRGTLTAEDRFKINEHMISTIRMLESLPFPEELKNVPRYASTHHETLKGSGYPRRLCGDELSIPERILAVADIFEALTASDRPYKKAKPVSVAIDILHNMVLDNHVDRDCFELFVREKVYLEYAREYLQAEQIDEVDLGKYLLD